MDFHAIISSIFLGIHFIEQYIGNRGMIQRDL